MLVCCMMYTASAQKLSPTFLGVAGKAQTSGGKNLSWSIGELIVTTGSGNSYYLTQGFQQPDWMVMGLAEFNPNVDFSVFPNPTVGLVNVYIRGLSDFRKYQLSVYDIMGRLQEVKSEKEGNSNETTILLDLTNLNPGQYFIRIIPENSGKQFIEFKIVKVD